MESPASKTAAAPGRPAPWLVAGVIFLAALAAYWNSFHVPLLMDDDQAIAHNATIRHLWPLSDVLTPPAYSGPSGRPVLNLSYALNYAVGGDEVFGYHAVNFALHVLTALVLFGVVRRTLLAPRLQGRFTAVAGHLAAAIALLWAVHPVLTAAVTYLSQRAEVLMALFYLLTFYGFLRAAADIRAAPRWQVFSVACCWLGMATKEVMVTAPFIVFVFDSIFVSGSPRQAWRARGPFYAGLAASWVFLAGLMILMSKRSVGFHQGVNPWNYALTECRALTHYVQVAVWPHPLVFDFGPGVVSGLLTVLPQALFVLLLLAATAVALWRAPAAGFLGLWFFVILAPTSSFVPVALQPVAESRMYLPLAAVITGLVLAVYRVLGARTAWLVLGVGLGLTAAASLRNGDYRDELTIWKDTLAERPDNPRAHDNLGIALSRAGRTDEALGNFQRAVALGPDIGRFHYNLGRALQDKGRTEEALHEYEAASRLDPTSLDAEVNLAVVLAERGQEEQARGHLERALQLNSDDADSHYNLGLVLYRGGQLEASVREFQRALGLDPRPVEPRDALGTALFHLGRPQEAMSQYEEVLRTNPDHAVTHQNLGNVLFTLDRPAEAREHFARAVQLKPDYRQALTSLGVVELQLGDVENARGHFEAALRLDPDDAEAHFRLGNILAMAGRMSEALGQWRETVRLRPDDAEAHNNYAIALTEAGRIDEAIRHYEEALRLRPDYSRARNNLSELRARQKSAAEK